MDRALKPSVVTVVGTYYSFSREVPWLINQNFQKCSVAVLLLPLWGKSIATGFKENNFNEALTILELYLSVLSTNQNFNE